MSEPTQVHDAIEKTRTDHPVDPEQVIVANEPVQPKPGSVSDGYHTSDELYEHRAVLFALATSMTALPKWRSWKHEDGFMFEGMFIVGFESMAGPATYHVNADRWDLFEHCTTLETAPPFDGHTPAQALERLVAHLRWVQANLGLTSLDQ